jgi:hypothetical protein
VPVRTGTDGGMNPVFLAAVQAHGGTETRIESSSLPGSIPANIRPPGEPMPEGPTGSTGGTMSLASSDSRPVSGGFFGGLFSSGGDSGKPNDSGNPNDSGKTSDKSSSASGGVFSRMFGLRGAEGETTPAPKPKAKPATQTAAVGAVRPKPPAQPPAPAQGDVKTANSGTAKPAPDTTGTAPPQPTAAGSTSLISGGQAALPSSFADRWNTMR